MTRLVALVAAVALVGACGSGSARVLRAPTLPARTVPTVTRVAETELVVQRNADPATRRAFASVGAASLVEQAGVWELRNADRLVGTLQLVTLDPDRSDTRVQGDRDEIRAQILPGTSRQLDVDGLPVWSGLDGERALYVWFGAQVLGVLQVKGDEAFNAEDAATTIVASITEHRSWPSMSLDVFEEDR